MECSRTCSHSDIGYSDYGFYRESMNMASLDYNDIW